MSITSQYEQLLEEISALYQSNSLEANAVTLGLFETFLAAMERGHIRTASRDEAGRWSVEPRIKQGILVGFRLGQLTPFGSPPLQFFEKDTYPSRTFTANDGVRVVPGGTSVRRGAYCAKGVILMAPSYVNVGAYIDHGTLIDSNALVGSCAQIGQRVHISAGVQIGGVIEPIGAQPVIVEDDVLVGGQSGIFEGTIVRKGAVIGAGTILTKSTKVYDLVNDTIIHASAEHALEIPANAVIVPGSRAVRGDFASTHGLHIQTPLLIKYRDEKTDAQTALEDVLRI